MLRFIVLLTVSTLACAGSGLNSDPPDRMAWQPTTETSLNADQMTQLEQASEAQKALASSLMGLLVKSIDDGGPASSIGVCRNAAGLLSTKVGSEHGLTIGRTSQRLRNPTNEAPEWARGHVRGDSTSPAFLAAPDGRLGVLKPIMLKSQCEMCHGPANAIDEDVQVMINTLYPLDQATGMASGELRGWFWIEVPPSEGS